MPKTPTHDTITKSFIEDVCQRLASNKPVKRSIPGGGILSIDRELPFLCVYRRDPEFADAGTYSFANHEAAYLSAPGAAPVRKGLASLIRRIGEQAANRFGAFLILEIRSASDLPTEDPKTREHQLAPPTFRIHAEERGHCPETVSALRDGLEQVRLKRQPAVIDIQLNSHAHPIGLKRVMSSSQAINCISIGLEILPIYRDSETGVVFPEVLEELRRKVSKALKKAFYAFSVHHTNLRPHHYYALGRRRIARSVWEIDNRLATVGTSFDLLVQVTPINADFCWNEFKKNSFSRLPEFDYRPLPFDPFVMKRELIDIPVEQVDDPTLANILRSTQDELDRQLTMLVDIGSPRFHQGSLQVYGPVEGPLLEQARSILELMPGETKRELKARKLGPVAFAHRAEAEVRRYRQLDPSFTAVVELRDDMYSGLLVSGNRLFVGNGTSVPEDRVDALLSHEIGTHLVTRHNGQLQPMRLLQSGLAGYDPLQEGLAVLAEYLVGGLSGARLRTLAARVVATDAMIRGATFVEVFAMLVETHGFSPNSAYTIVLRVYRGGGFTKDAGYLRGLDSVLGYLHSGGDLKMLYVGKLAADHIPLIRELLSRRILRWPQVLPHFLTAPSMTGNLERLRSFSTVLDLANELRKSA